MKKIITLIFTFTVLGIWAQNYKLSGYVRDAENGEDLIGATIYVKELKNGALTNVYGFYSLTLAKGTYNILVQYVGYAQTEFELVLDGNAQKNIELTPEGTLEEVVVVEEKQDENLVALETGTNELTVETLKSLPAFAGEVDIIRSLQLLPGISTVGEGATGFNVRGGRISENLILLDEAPVYNSSHMFGFFSVFNPDATKDVKVYKAGIPARYGGRGSSVLDVRMKEGNKKELEVNGGISTIFSRLSVEAPIIKDKSSFIVAGRRSYIDVLAQPFLKGNLKGTKVNFYDLTAKVNFNHSDKDRFFLSSYFGRDNYSIAGSFNASWGNATTSLRWNHVYNNNLFGHTTLYFTNYDYNLKFGTGARTFNWKATIVNYGAKAYFDYYLNTNTLITFGIDGIYYIFNPGETTTNDVNSNSATKLPDQYALELGGFIDAEQKLTNFLDVVYGFRYSRYSYLGPGTIYTFKETEEGRRAFVDTEKKITSREEITTYQNFEPRVLLNFKLNTTASLKLSYDRTAQYIHLLSNTAASSPLDIWRSSTNNIKPQINDQYSVGYFQNFQNNAITGSAQLYYKDFQNIIEYIDGSNLLLNELVEGDIFPVKGRAYGLELMVEKKTGKWQGWVSYTLSRSEQITPAFSNNKWYPTRFDQTHNLKLVSYYDLNERIRMSGTFSFISGTPNTLAGNQIAFQGKILPYSPSSARNNFRIPAYHRLDLAIEVHRKKLNRKGKPIKNDSFWVVSLYNTYLRRNPYSIYIDSDENDNGVGRRLSIVGTVIPSISYNFKF